MISENERQAIQKSWALAVPVAETVADLFYKRLFEIAPQYRPLFKQDMAAQKRKLLGMLAFLVKSLDWPDSAWDSNVEAQDDLFLVVLALGRRHTELYHIPDESYDAVGAALLWTLDYGLGEAFTPEVKQAWTTLYTRVATTMKMSRLASTNVMQNFQPMGAES